VRCEPTATKTLECTFKNAGTLGVLTSPATRERENAGCRFRRGATRQSPGFTPVSPSSHRPAASHAAQVEPRPPPKKRAFRLFRVFPWFMNIPIPSVLIHVHPWLKKHPSRDRFAAQVELRPSGPDCVPAQITSRAKSSSRERRTERKKPPHVHENGRGLVEKRLRVLRALLARSSDQRRPVRNACTQIRNRFRSVSFSCTGLCD
jgi:hypothetical protein